MRIVGPLARLYQYVAPLGFAVQQPIEWRRNRRQVRRLRRARADPVDIVDISAEAVFRFAALSFDPRRLALGEAHALVRSLHGYGAIDRRTAKAFRRALRHAWKSIEPDDADRPRDLIAALEQLQSDSHPAWRASNDIAIALGLLRTVDVRRRAQ